MAKKVTQKDIQQFNELYFKYHNYSEVARQTGWSATTVKRYIVPDYTPQESLRIIKFLPEQIPPVSTIYFKNTENWGELCELFDNEQDEIVELWEELSL